MQIYKNIFLLFFFTTTLAFSQTATQPIQAPVAPTITGPSVTAPTIPSLQMSTLPDNATVKTTTDATKSNPQSLPSELSTDLTATALETLSGLFGDDTGAFTDDSLAGLGSFSSLGDLSTLLNQELTTTDDPTTIALLQEILLKLTELEAKIDNLEANQTSTKEAHNEQ